MRTHARLLFASIALLTCGAVAAQPVPAPAPPTPAEPVRTTTLDTSGIEYFQKAYSLTAAEASRRLSLQDRIGALAEKLETNEAAVFGDLYIEHQPTYRIVVNLTQGGAEVVRKYTTDAELLAALEIKTVANTITQLRATQDQLLTQLAALKIRAFSTIDPKTGIVKLIAPDLAPLRQLVLTKVLVLPSYVVLETGPLSEKTQATPYISGGHVYYLDRDPNMPNCTFAFGAREGTTYGILTAGHCEPGVDGKYWHNAPGGVWRELPLPSYEAQRLDTKYDFQWHKRPLDYKVYNTVQTDTNGAFYVIGTVGFLSQKVGMGVCKYGNTTRYGCGTIVDGNAANEGGTRGFILVRNASNLDLANRGDSGGATFGGPATSDIKAYGIISERRINPNGAYDVLYMPIDYIDDVRTTLTVMTAPSP